MKHIILSGIGLLLSQNLCLAGTPELEKIVAIQQSQIQKLIQDNQKLRADFDAQKATTAGLRVWQFDNAWSYSTYPNEAASPFVPLPFSINGGGAGATYLLLCSLNSSDGDATRSSVDAVRAGYNGNHYSIDHISGASVIYNHRVRADGRIEVQTFGGNARCIALSNKG